jgi:beta-N-acetylhexosaminidase
MACVFALGLVTAGCSAASGSASGAATGAASRAPHAVSGLASTPKPSPTPTPRSCASAVYSRMTPAQRAGQLFMVGMPLASGRGASGGPGAEVTGAIRAYHFGSVLFAGDSSAGTARIGAVTREVQALASMPATAGTRFFVAANQEGGQIQQLTGPGFASIPSAVGQGTLPPAVLRRAAATWGRELRSAGVNLDLAPVMDVVPPGTAAQNAPIGMLQREYGDNPAAVASHGVPFIDGMRDAGVATSAKHFPGLGRVRGNTDFTPDVVDTVTTASDPYLKSFQGAIGAGVPFVMVALATYQRIDPRHLAVFSARIMDGVLRQRMGFKGVIVSDDLGAAAAVAGIPPGTRAIGFLAAGGDLIVSVSVQAAVQMDDAVLRKAASDAAFRAEVSTAVIKILTAKASYGLLSC